MPRACVLPYRVGIILIGSRGGTCGNFACDARHGRDGRLRETLCLATRPGTYPWLGRRARTTGFAKPRLALCAVRQTHRKNGTLVRLARDGHVMLGINQAGRELIIPKNVG